MKENEIKAKDICEIAVDGFSFHTMELTKTLSVEEYEAIVSLAYKRAENGECQTFRGKKNKNIVYVNHIMRGLKVRLISNRDRPPLFLAIVNPRFLLGDFSYVGIFQKTEDNYKKLITQIHSALEFLNAPFAVDELNLHRIDLCVNLVYKSGEMLRQYMRIIRKAYIPSSYRRVSFDKTKSDYKEKNRRNLRLDNSFRMVTVYDKIFECEKKQYPLSEKERMMNILRIEVSLKRLEVLKITEAMGNGGGRYSLENILKSFGNISLEIIHVYIGNLFPVANCISYNNAIGVINDACKKKLITKGQECRMIELIEKTSSCKNVNAALEILEQNSYQWHKRKKIEILDCFKEIHLNPVTLKRKSQLNLLPPILSLLKMENDEEESFDSSPGYDGCSQ